MLPDNLRVKNVKTLVKFRVNRDNPHSRNRIITHTLGKIGFINQLYRGVIPQDEEFWLVNIDSMITRGTPVSGVFILTPIYAVDREMITYTVPGMYDIEDDAGIRYVKPNLKNGYWLMSIQDRRPLIEPSIHAIIVLSDPDDQSIGNELSYSLGVHPPKVDLNSVDEELGLSNSNDFEMQS